MADSNIGTYNAADFGIKYQAGMDHRWLLPGEAGYSVISATMRFLDETHGVWHCYSAKGCLTTRSETPYVQPSIPGFALNRRLARLQEKERRVSERMVAEAGSNTI